MKALKSIFSLLACLCLIPMQAQTVDKEALYIYQTDGRANIFFRNEVTAISLEMKNGVMHQVVYTGNKPHYFAVSKIQSMSFVHPEEDNYRPLIIGDEGSPTFGKAIDLGLPSGTKWASFNVGAHSPEQYGGLYGWGETIERNYNYPGCPPDYYYDELGLDITGTLYDVAHMQWGEPWCMPTWDDFMELLDNCTDVWTTLNGVNGCKFTSKINGRTIFLPAAGATTIFERNQTGETGYYWLSTRGRDRGGCRENGYYFFPEIRFVFDESSVGWYNYPFPSDGRSVRPVVRN